MRYKLFFELNHQNGTVIDKCWQTPFEFEEDDGQIDQCLQRCIASATVGRLETFLLSPEEAFGNYDDGAVQTIKRSEFDPSLSLDINTAVCFDLPNGSGVLGYVKQLDDTSVVIDFNHLLAGQNISFKVEVLEASEHKK